MNFSAILDKHSGSQIDAVDGAIFVESKPAVVYVDEERIRKYSDEFQSKEIAERIQDLRTKFGSVLRVNISWKEARWKSTLLYIAQKNTKFSRESLGELTVEIGIGLPNSQKRHCLLSKESNGTYRFYVSETFKNSSEYKVAAEKVMKKYLGTRIEVVDGKDIGIIRELLDKSDAAQEQTESEARNLLVRILTDAVNQGASDIHIHACKRGDSRYGFRIIKMLIEQDTLSFQDATAMARSAWRCEGSDNTTEWNEQKSLNRRVELKLDTNKGVKKYFFRYQQSKTDSGFKLVLRVIDSDPEKISRMSLKGMGYLDSQVRDFEEALLVNKGAIIFVGVTNSGKTTSIAKKMSILHESRPELSIDSMEDTVEFVLPGITQHPISVSNIDSEGLTEEEAQALAASTKLSDLLRMDPDVISVGEIRDKTIAKIFSKANRTGHKTFATLHTSNAITAYSRLNEIDVDYSTTSEPGFITMIVWQTLIPVLCDSCKICAPDSVQQLFEKSVLLGRSLYTRNPIGCSNCNLGYKGLTACAEIIRPDPEFNDYIRRGDIYSAGKYWESKLRPAYPDCQYTGVTIEDSIIWKMAQGEIAVDDVQSNIGFSLEKILSKNSERFREILSPLRLNNSKLHKVG